MSRIILFHIAFFISVFCGQTYANELSTQDILKALTPTQKQVRSATRGVSVDQGEQDVPSIDMRIEFEFDSADLTTEAIISLQALGNALTHERLKPYHFQIIGHTDAKGTANYNQKLSERRAEAIKEHLVFFHEVNAERLIHSGLGENQLFDKNAPEDPINRRVEIKNLIVKK